jgi:hypothetical protein
MTSRVSSLSRSRPIFLVLEFVMPRAQEAGGDAAGVEAIAGPACQATAACLPMLSEMVRVRRG